MTSVAWAKAATSWPSQRTSVKSRIQPYEDRPSLCLAHAEVANITYLILNHLSR